MNVGYLLISIAVLGSMWIGVRAFGLIRFNEKPDAIIGAKIRLVELDGFGATPPDFAECVIQSYSDHSYRVEFLESLAIDGCTAKGALIAARHVGYPISRAGRWKRRICAVTGELDSGQRFTALVQRA